MAFSIAPYFARVFYTVANIPHVMTLPLHLYTPPATGHAFGQVTRWDATVEDADTVLEAKLTAWADLFTTDAEFNSIFFYTQATPAVEPILRAAKNISIPGTMTITAGEEHLAVQVTFNFLTTSGQKFRRQLMEANSRNAYTKITDYSTLTADEQALVDETLADSAVWAARDDTQPYIWRSRTCTLNDKLRKERRMT